MKKIIFFGLLFFSASLLFAQNAEEVQKIVSSYDLVKLKELETSFRIAQESNLQSAKEYALKNQLPLETVNPDGSVNSLIGIDSNNTLLYYSIDNVNAARSTRTTFLNSNLNMNGANMTVGVWDGGPARVTHQEYGGRANVFDGSALNSNSFHATHVAGTIAAAGINPAAKGMASLATIKTFDWFNDGTEALAQVQQGLLISNHSYGTPITSVAPWYVGAYSSASRDWDVIAFNSPFYLMVASAGNSGNETNTSASTPGFDKLTGNKVSKNNLVVANTQQASINSAGELIAVSINSSSSHGPADDSRIKPDIAGQGTGLFSSGDASDTSYLTLTGTSMSSPNVAGSLILLQQYYNQRNNRFMKSATLKGLVCHTADDAGNPGPDARFGWGLLNCKKAAETILFNGLTGFINENKMNQGETKTYTFTASGSTPFSATICWTDRAGTANNGTNNLTTPALVNDLDIRISDGSTTFFPWKLQSNAALNATRNSDNNVDNVESVKIDTPTNTTYTVTVTHKNALVGGNQDFALIVTGIESSFAINPIVEEVATCNTQNAVFSFEFKNLDFNSVSVTANSLPAGAMATFSQNTLFVDDVFTMTVSNLTNVPAGTYNIVVQGTKGTEIKNTIVKLVVYNTTFTSPVYTFPTNNSTNVASNTNFQWQVAPNATSYILEVSTSNLFATTVFSNETTQTSMNVSGLVQDQLYFWRVLPKNQCGTATTANTGSFRVGSQSCANNYTATDFSNATISSDLGLAVIPINVTDNFSISDLTVNLNVSHNVVQELKVFLEAPAGLNLPDVLLINQSCGSVANINASIKDSFPPLVCSTTVPAISGSIKPFQNMIGLNNKSALGIWKLKVSDDIVGNGGTVNSFSLNFCNVASSLSTVENNISQFKLYPNPAENQITIELTDDISNANLTLYDIQGRVIYEKEAINQVTNIDTSILQSGVYFVKLKSNNSYFTKRFIKK